MTTERTYTYHTVEELINTLQNLVNNSETLTMKSPIMISDFNMSGYKEKFSVLPTFSTNQNLAGICLFHSLGNLEETLKKEPVVEEAETDFEDEVDVEDEEPTPVRTLSNGSNQDRLMSFIEKYGR